MDNKTGVFYAVGVGPGDPELLTCKAVRVLTACPVIAAPQTDSGQMLALDIVRPVVTLDGHRMLPLCLPMTRNRGQMDRAYADAAEQIAAFLDKGEDVAMVNLGDVSLYATSAPITALLQKQGYHTEMVPGVPSFCAAAARLGQPLVQGEQPLLVLPANSPETARMLSLPGTKVLMKPSRNLSSLKAALAGQSAAMVERCGLEGERVYPALSDFPEHSGYFTTVIVKEPER